MWIQNAPHLFGIVPLQHPQSCELILQRERDKGGQTETNEALANICVPSRILWAHHRIRLLPTSDQGCRGSVCVFVNVVKKWTTGRWSIQWSEGGGGWGCRTAVENCNNSLRHLCCDGVTGISLTPSSVPLIALYFMYLHSWRCKGTAHNTPSLWLAGGAGLHAGVIDDYGTTASGIMLAEAIYKQKQSLCCCQLQCILPFLSQTPLERAPHSGSNVIFYWETIIPHIEMAKESY